MPGFTIYLDKGTHKKIKEHFGKDSIEPMDIRELVYIGLEEWKNEKKRKMVKSRRNRGR